VQSSNPQSFINRASIIAPASAGNGDKVTVLAAAEDAAQRARLTAQQEARPGCRAFATQDERQGAGDSSAGERAQRRCVHQAMSIFKQTRPVSNSRFPGKLVGVQAPQEGADPGVAIPMSGVAPGPTTSTLRTRHVGLCPDGISLRISPAISGIRSQTSHGASWSRVDLVFFFPDISHVGMYVGDGLMLDAPTFGQPVQIRRSSGATT